MSSWQFSSLEYTTKSLQCGYSSTTSRFLGKTTWGSVALVFVRRLSSVHTVTKEDSRYGSSEPLWWTVFIRSFHVPNSKNTAVNIPTTKSTTIKILHKESCWIHNVSVRSLWTTMMLLTSSYHTNLLGQIHRSFPDQVCSLTTYPAS